MSTSDTVPLPLLALDGIMGPLTIHNTVGRALVVTIEPPRSAPFAIDPPVLSTSSQGGAWEPSDGAWVVPLMCDACGVKEAVALGDQRPVCLLCSTWADLSGPPGD